MLFVVEVDFESNVVFTDNGAILEVDTYVDEDDNPCLPEESVALYYMAGTSSILRHDYTDEELDRIEDA